MAHNDYWLNAYKQPTPLAAVPSQFAAFIASEEIGRSRFIVDFGCGDGRDSVFFARCFPHVLAVDQSTAAVALTRSRFAPFAGSIAVRCNASHASDQARLLELVRTRNAKPVVLYARFFLHSLTDEEVKSFLGFCGEFEVGTRLCVEYRTVADANLQKVTPEHFRNFLNPDAVNNWACGAGFKPVFRVEGRGFAKWREDDAFVARQVWELP